jgi:hypothetical protein
LGRNRNGFIEIGYGDWVLIFLPNSRRFPLAAKSHLPFLPPYRQPFQPYQKLYSVLQHDTPIQTAEKYHSIFDGLVPSKRWYFPFPPPPLFFCLDGLEKILILLHVCLS